MKDWGYQLGGGSGILGSVTCISLDSGWDHSFNFLEWVPITAFFCIKVAVAGVLAGFIGMLLQELTKTDTRKWIGLKKAKRQLT